MLPKNSEIGGKDNSELTFEEFMKNKKPLK